MTWLVRDFLDDGFTENECVEMIEYRSLAPISFTTTELAAGDPDTAYGRNNHHGPIYQHKNGAEGRSP